MDIATLVIRIDASQVGPAQTALKGLGAEGVRVQTATGGATVGMGRLNNAILGLARQATGTHPVIARFADVLFSMALGGARMTAVLAGLAAVALAYRALTRDAKFAREEAERLHNALRDLATPEGADRARVIAFGTSALRQAQAELAVLRSRDVAADFRLRGGPSGQAALAAARERHAEDVNTALNRVLVLNAQLMRATGTPFAFEGPLQDGGAQMGALMDRAARSIEAFMRIEMPKLVGGVDASIQEAAFRARFVRPGSAGTPVVGDVTDIAAGSRTGLTPLLSVSAGRAAYERVVQRELELTARRQAANQALVLSLANVGRAYGGVVDQVLNLTAATMSIAQAGRLPGFGRGETASRGDMAIGLGSAALTGIGFGASTGNVGIGGIGGAASGFAMAGPYGALVGGVAGIVSGLLESGRRAQEAARQWKIAFQDFSLMFDDVDPLTANLRANERMFQQLSGGLTPAQAREALNQGASDFGLEKLFGVTRAELEALLVEYEKNAVQANELAVAEKRLHDARRDVLQALNAPAGLNLAAYGYSAASSGAMVVQGDFIVHVDGGGDARETALRVFEEGRRRMLQGGQSPYLDVPR